MRDVLQVEKEDGTRLLAFNWDDTGVDVQQWRLLDVYLRGEVMSW
jgi:hypothetical protein